MGDVTVDVTNGDDTDNVTVETYTHDLNIGSVKKDTARVILEPGAGTSIVITDEQAMVVRMSSRDLPIKLTTAHQAGEADTVVETPVEP